MFERFTRDARAAVVLGQEEARELGDRAMGPEHLLVGVLRSAGRELAAVLTGYGLTVDAMRARDLEAVAATTRSTIQTGMPRRCTPSESICRRCGRCQWRLRLRCFRCCVTPVRPSASRRGQIAMSRAAKKALELALREALAHKAERSDAEHLILAILRGGDRLHDRDRHRTRLCAAVAACDHGVPRSGGIAARASLAERQRRRHDDRPHQHRQSGIAQHRNQLRPAASRSHRSGCANRQRCGHQAGQAPRRRQRQDQRSARPAMTSSARIKPAGARVAEPNSQSDLAGAGSVGISRRLLATSTADDRQPIVTAATRPTQSTRSAWVYWVPRTATKPKNTNTATSPKPEVAVGLRATGVQPRAGDAGGAHGDQPRIGRRSPAPGRPSQPSAGSHRGGQHRPRRRDPRTHQSQRSGTLVVGAANAVGVVVGVVDPDDQRDRDEQRQQRLPPHRTAQPGRRAGAGDDGCDGVGQGARAGAFNPLRDGGHQEIVACGSAAGLCCPAGGRGSWTSSRRHSRRSRCRRQSRRRRPRRRHHRCRRCWCHRRSRRRRYRRGRPCLPRGRPRRHGRRHRPWRCLRR